MKETLENIVKDKEIRRIIQEEYWDALNETFVRRNVFVTMSFNY